MCLKEEHKLLGDVKGKDHHTLGLCVLQQGSFERVEACLYLQCVDSAPSNMSLHVPGTVAPRITGAVPREGSARLPVIDNRIGISLVNLTTLVYPTVSICHTAAAVSTEEEAGICKVSKQ